MELRSQSDKIEYNTLESTLCGLGMYEDGMKLEEMRQIMQALQESELENETAFFDNDMERALKESELDFVQMQRDAHSSTMIKCAADMPDYNANTLQHPYGTRIKQQHAGASPFSSPEIPAQQLSVQVDVHHAYDWSPTAQGHKPLEFDERSQRKRFSMRLSAGATKENAIELQNVKRLKTPATCISPTRGDSSDSGIQCSSAGTSSASITDSNSNGHSMSITESHSSAKQEEQSL